MSLNSNTQELNTILDTMNNLPIGNGGLKQIGEMIDESGVLDSTEGTVEEKVGELIDYNAIYNEWIESLKNQDTNDYRFQHYRGTRLPLKYNVFNNTKNMRYFCSCAENLKSIDFCIVSEAESLSLRFCFYETYALENIVGIRAKKIEDMGACFQRSGIETIEEPLDVTGTINLHTAFTYAARLKNIRFVSNCINSSSITFSSAVLTAESIQSIIDGLATVETTQTLTLNKAIVLTDEQKATINAKGWTLAQ